MKAEARKFARKFRRSGHSVREIAKQTRCSKSSISKWVRDIPLTSEQIKKLKSNQDKGRAKAANHPNSPKNVWAKIRSNITKSAAGEISSKCSLDTLKVVGSSLYWAEGYKSGLNMVNFCNSDPCMIRLMMDFFKKVCKVPIAKFRGAVHIHPHLDREKAVKFWSKISGIPIKQFHKTQIAVSKASKNKRDTLPLGTFRIVISDTRLKSRIKGWIKGIEKWINIRAVGAVEAHLVYTERVVGSNPTPPTIESVKCKPKN